MDVFAFRTSNVVADGGGSITAGTVTNVDQDSNAVAYSIEKTEHPEWPAANDILADRAGIDGVDDILALCDCHDGAIARRGLLDHVRNLAEPNADAYYVVDVVDISEVDAWTWLTPTDFADRFPEYVE